MFYKLVFGWKARCAALKYVLTIAYVWSSQSYILISVPYSFPGSSSLFSSSLVVEQPWACFTSADWLWKTPMSRKCRPDCREILFSFCICVLTCIFYGQTKCWRSTFTVFLSDGIARITQSHGTKWSPINSTKYEQYKVLSIIYTNIIQIFYIILNNLDLKQISLTGNTYLSCYHVAKSMLPCHTDSTCLCMFPAV